MPTAIVYFTKSGNTEFAARELAKRLDADVVKLEEQSRRKGLFGFLSGGFQSATHRSSRLVGHPWTQVSEFDTLYLMTPMWASNTTPAMNSFLSKVELSGKTVHGITFQADPDKKGSGQAHEFLKKKIIDRGGTPGHFYAMHSTNPGQFAGEQKLREQIFRVE